MNADWWPDLGGWDSRHPQVSISGNDVTACGTNPNPVGCVLTALTAINLNVEALVTDLRSALDSNPDATAKIIGLTYPDVLLGAWVYPTVQTTSTLAGLSVLAFDSFINPALKTIYTGWPMAASSM